MGDVDLALVPLGTLTLVSGPRHDLGPVPLGKRIVWEIADVVWESERLHARKKGALAGDWLLIGADGTAHLDLRFLLETGDGAMIYVSGPGRVDLSAGGGRPGYLATTFETGDTRYAWLNRVVAVGRAQATATGFVYSMYELR
jgi:hypothetical protein